MKKQIIGVAIVILFLNSCLKAPVKTNTISSSEPPVKTSTVSPESLDFPLSKGSYWIYKGTQTNQGEQGIVTEEITWRMEVVEVIQREKITGYLVDGYPVPFMCNEDEYGKSLIVQVENIYYCSDIEMLDSLKDEKNILVGIISEERILFDFPLFLGKKFCELEQITRTDDGYCWVVTDDEQVVFDQIQGISPEEERTKYTLYFRTLPDHLIVDFVPGIGITEVEYVHHGTISQMHVRLVEYHAANK